MEKFQGQAVLLCALVVKKCIVEMFLRNLLLNEKHELHNRKLHISGLLNEEKVDIGDAKVDIQDAKVDIQSVLSIKGSDFSVKMTENSFQSGADGHLSWER